MAPRRACTRAVPACWYLVTYAAQACLVPFLNVFFIRAGVSRRRVGVLAAARPLLAAVSGNLWAMLADATQSHGAIFVLTFVAAGVSRRLLLPAAAAGFPVLLAAVLIMEIVSSPVNVLADASVTVSRGASAYGKTRLFGAVGWGAFAPVGGAILSKFGVAAAFDANAAGWLGPGLALSLALARPMAALRRGGGVEADEHDRTPHPPLSPIADAPLVTAPELVAFDGHAAGADTTPLLPTCAADGGDRGSTLSALAAAATPEAALFLITAFNFGAAMGAIDTWLFVVLDESLKAPPELLGLTLTVTCIAEVPVLAAAGRLIDRFGPAAVWHVVHVAFLVRLAWYWALPLLPSPWWVLVAEPLHGVTFGAAWAAGVARAAALAPPGLAATVQSIYAGCYLGLGSAAGAFLGGIVHASLGGRAVFAVAAALLASVWAVTTTAEACLARRRRETA